MKHDFEHKRLLISCPVVRQDNFINYYLGRKAVSQYLKTVPNLIEQLFVNTPLKRAVVAYDEICALHLPAARLDVVAHSLIALIRRRAMPPAAVWTYREIFTTVVFVWGEVFAPCLAITFRPFNIEWRHRVLPHPQRSQ